MSARCPLSMPQKGKWLLAIKTFFELNFHMFIILTIGQKMISHYRKELQKVNKSFDIIFKTVDLKAWPKLDRIFFRGRGLGEHGIQGDGDVPLR